MPTRDISRGEHAHHRVTLAERPLDPHAAVAPVRGLPYAVSAGTVAMAGAALDHHDGPLGRSAVGAAELHQGGLGGVGRAAAAVAAGATVARLVGLHAAAVPVGEVNCLDALHHPLALAASLGDTTDRAG